MSPSREEKDSFWDLSKLVPKKTSVMSKFVSSGVPSAPVTDDTPAVSHPEGKLTFSKEADAPETVETYTPASSWITNVVIHHPFIKYDFYDTFRKSALVYFDVRGSECPFVPFYSYMPQYAQMKKEQKDYYFYFRSCVRRGEYPKSDYSYVYLYVYEVLNLPDKISPNVGVVALAHLWHAYRRELPVLDKYFSVWMQDYCLLYRLPFPKDVLAEDLPDILAGASWKEFYLSELDIGGEGGLSLLLRYFSDYDWHTGKYATGDSKEAYRKHMEGAMRPILSEVFGTASLSDAPTCVLSRFPFPNALVTATVKCRLEITYHPLWEAKELREGITAAVKYTENKLRCALGIKSRLAVKFLPDAYKAKIDAYFDRTFSALKVKNRPVAPEYEKRYDAPEGDLSFGGADTIERSSWSTTLRLVSEEERLEMTQTPPPVSLPQDPAPAVVSEQNKEKMDTYGLTSCQIRFLTACLHGDVPAYKAVAKEIGATVDSLTEQINEAFSEGFGDIVIESLDDGYGVIEEYREDVEAWLNKQT